MKKYKIGMYGGKFMPMHIGHYHCLKTAAEECETVYLILFYGSKEENKIHSQYPNAEYLSLNSRIKQVFKVAKQFTNVIPIVLDVSSCLLENNEYDWDAETPLVTQACGGTIEAVYGTKVENTEYFEKAYPFAEYRILDPERKYIRINSKDLREMPFKERIEWMV